MRSKRLIFILAVAYALPLIALAQGPPPLAPGRPGGPGMGPPPGAHGMGRQEMGKWWKDSELAKKLQLSDGQIHQLDQIFYDHRMKLIDYGAQMEKEDLKLQSLLDADVPNESQVGSQVDQVLTARGKLEREFTMMNLDLRKVLSVEQWRQLKTIREERRPTNEFFHKRFPEGGPHEPPPGGPGGGGEGQS
jgi:Spy/CpxP family protein refolding chaperone